MRLIMMLCAGLLCQTSMHAAAQPEPFTVAVLPDTQKMAQNHPEIYDSMTAWLATQVEPRNIVFTTHVGDIINNHDQIWQWENAVASMNTLSAARMPWFAVGGNHDASKDPYSSKNQNYLQYFGPSSLYDYDNPAFLNKNEQAWFGGSSPSGMSSYTLIDNAGGSAGGDGLDLMFVHINIGIHAEELAWAEQAVANNPGRLVFVITHDYVVDIRVFRGRGGAYFLSDPTSPVDLTDGNDGLFFKVLGKYPNVIGLWSGHIDGETFLPFVNGRGAPGWQWLLDFQSNRFGGDGWLKLFTFDPVAGTIAVETYSPWKDGGRVRTVADQVSDLEFVLGDQLRKIVDPLQEIILPISEAIESIPSELAALLGATSGYDLVERVLALDPQLIVRLYELARDDPDGLVAEIEIILGAFGQSGDDLTDLSDVLDLLDAFRFEQFQECLVYGLPPHLEQIADRALTLNANDSLLLPDGTVDRVQLEANTEAVLRYIFDPANAVELGVLPQQCRVTAEAGQTSLPLAQVLFYGDGSSAPSYILDGIDFARYTRPFDRRDLDDSGNVDFFDVLHGITVALPAREARTDYDGDGLWTFGDIRLMAIDIASAP